MACVLHKIETTAPAKKMDSASETPVETTADFKIVMSKNVEGFLTNHREIKWKQEKREPEDCPLYKLLVFLKLNF
jgi:tryptophanyl-tRNA synthetase